MSVSNEQPGWCEALYRAKGAELILYGRALGLSHAEAEDVLQETFLALTKLPEPPQRPDYYSIRAFRNRALNYRRSLWRRLAREWESRSWFEPAEVNEPGEVQAMNALARLPRPQREAIVLKIWHNCTFEEVGQLLGISPNTAAGRYRYGLQKLKSVLKGKGYERNDGIGESIALLGATPPVGEA